MNARLDILNNVPIEEKLHVVTVISNPCKFKRRYKLALDFIKRMEKDPRVILYVVELEYNDSTDFQVTSRDNPRHLQITMSARYPIWHKENLINIGIRELLPSDWKAVAWIDADIEFESAHWAEDTLKILNGSSDIVQLFSHCVDLGPREETLKIHESFGYKYSKGRSGTLHPGYAWAITRRAYEKIGGIYEESILGSGDYNMAMCLVGKGLESINNRNSKGYKKSIEDFQKKVETLRFGYVPGVIEHYWHGSKQKRGYEWRWRLLVDNQFDPSRDLTRDSRGLLIPGPEFPNRLLHDIWIYFKSRNEDDL
jgi:hypothetical protein